MSEVDELRYRIAYILESHAHLAIDQQACAIIDEFGLTVEAPTGFGITQHRVVGKWEKQ